MIQIGDGSKCSNEAKERHWTGGDEVTVSRVRKYNLEDRSVFGLLGSLLTPSYSLSKGTALGNAERSSGQISTVKS